MAIKLLSKASPLLTAAATSSSVIPSTQLRRHFFNFPSSTASSSSSAGGNGNQGDGKWQGRGSGHSTGTLRKVGKVSLYEERRIMSYSPKQLYQIIADVDAYHSFLPFATGSSVLHSQLRSIDGTTPRKSELHLKGWLREDMECENETWELEAELKIGAMGYEEAYVSLVELKKWSLVTATAKDSSLFKHLVTRWTLSPLSMTAQGEAQTQVDLSLAYAFASPFHAAAVGAVWEKISSVMVSGFEGRAEKVYGRTSPPK